MFEDTEQLFGTKRASCMILKTNKYPQTVHTHVYLYSLDTHYHDHVCFPLIFNVCICCTDLLSPPMEVLAAL